MGFSELAAGNFTFTESAITGITLAGATCTGGTNSTSSLAGSALSVSLANAESITCTFTNRMNPVTGTLTIVKQWTDQNGNVVTTGMPSAANFTATGAGLVGLTNGGFALNAGNSWQMAFQGLVTGNFTFTEAALSGWSLSGWTCTGATGSTSSLSGSTLSVALVAGESLTCTATNRMAAAGAAAINVAKRWLDVNGNVTTAGVPSSVGFTATGAGVGNFTLGTNGIWSTTFSDLGAGTFTFAETPIAGWTLVSASCVDAADASPISFVNNAGVFSLALAADQAADCTFTNQAMAVSVPIVVTPATPFVPTNQTIPSVTSPSPTITTVTSPSVLTPTAPSTAVAGVPAPSTAQPGASAVAGVQAPATGSGASADAGTEAPIVGGLAAIAASIAILALWRKRQA